MFREWMERNWFRWLVKGFAAGVVSSVTSLIGGFLLCLPFPFNYLSLILLVMGYGYAIEEIGLYGGE